jgi:glycosyltransferase involved in cell wall biosynthesis
MISDSGVIAILLPDLGGGGAERVSLILAHEFAHQGYIPEFVLMRRRGALLDEALASFAVVELGADRLRHVPESLAHYLRERRPGVVLAAMWPLTGMAVLANLLTGNRSRVVVSEHNDLRHSLSNAKANRFFLRCVGKYLYGAAAGVVAVSAGVADSITACTGLQRERITVIHNPTGRPEAASSRVVFENALCWWKEAKWKIISIGNLKEQKAHDDLLEAFAILSREMADCRLLILGEGSLRTKVESQILELNLKARVRLPGFDPNPYPYLENADLFVLSSRWEGLAIVILEALSMGVPVVSTDCPSGPRELLEDGKFGLLTEVGDPAALAACMRESLRSTHDPSALRRRSREFAPEIVASKYLELLASTVSSPRSRRP